MAFQGTALFGHLNHRFQPDFRIVIVIRGTFAYVYAGPVSWMTS